jgi:antitoxin component YwqK of YwqJK toxin-antitoxin module
VNPNTKLIFGLALVLSGCVAKADQPWSVDRKRAFVEQCLHDTNVFVINVPADTNPHRGMSPDVVKALWDQASRDGTMLYLYPDRLPQGFWSCRQFKKSGPAKTWYPNGQLAVDEQYDNGRLVTGTYYDEAGKLLGEMTNGTGRQLVYYMQRTDSQSVMDCTVTDYRDGLKDGVEVNYSNFAKGEKIIETHYKNGKQDGLQTSWDKGQKIEEANFKDGQLDGFDITWDSSGQTNSLTDYVGGYSNRTTTLFYPDGMKYCEAVYQANEEVSEKNWFTNGMLMSEELHGEKGMTAKSYDYMGGQTGEVTAGDGTLAVVSRGMPGFDVETYRDGKMTADTRLRPHINLVSDDDGLLKPANTATFHLEVIFEEPLKIFSTDLRLPTGVTSDNNLSFTATNFQVIQLKPFELKFPVPYQQWTGDIMADVNLKIEGSSIRFQSVVLHQEKP